MATNGKLKITKFKNRSGNVSWRVTGTTNGERIRKNFASHAEALNEKQQYNNVLSLNQQNRTAVTTMSDAQVGEAQDAYERLNGDHSLRFAVDFFLQHYRAPNCDYFMSQVLDDFYDDKLAVGVRERSITQLKSTLTRVATHVEGKKLHEITLEHLQAFIRKHKWSRKTQNNVRADIHSFFEWAKSRPRNWVSVNPAHDLPKFKLERGVPEILDAKTAARIMKVLARYKGGDFVPYFALALFAGIRPQFPSGELGKLAKLDKKIWKLVDLKNKVIRIPPEFSKTSEYRTVDIQPNLKAWLQPYAKRKAPIRCPNFERGYKLIRKHFGIGHDVLRHSFISYHCAQFQSVGGSALQAGNSEAIVRRHYLKMVSKKEAAAFWKIKPN
ncbi:MAG: phage integrase N-terminal SAM-like domain-containing protein [Lentimonas sp.]